MQIGVHTLKSPNNGYSLDYIMLETTRRQAGCKIEVSQSLAKISIDYLLCYITLVLGNYCGC